jgi:outer membrane protein TolC
MCWFERSLQVNLLTWTWAMRTNSCTATRVMVVALLLPALAGAQEIERVTFDEAVQRALANHPTVQQAAAGVLRAEALLQQTRSRSLPTVDASFSTSVIGPLIEFAGSSITPRTQTLTTGGVAVPLFVPVSWAARHQAQDQVLASQAVQADARRAIALQTGRTYLAVIAQRRVLELNERARENARAHYDYADQRFQGGLGSRLNALRAQQELSGDEARVEDARMGLRRTQEALGVLVAVDHPVDAAGEPSFILPAQTTGDLDLVRGRTDVLAIVSRQTAAERVFNDAWKSYLPTATARFAPQLLAPAGLFANSRSWSTSVQLSIPLFDGGQRRGETRERQALLDIVRLERNDAERQAASEIRTAREAIQAGERALVHARAAATQAAEVLRITDVAFREGATTNIEVIDAQRRARDAETAAAVAEDTLRQAQLELLGAVGRFP